MYFRGGFLTDFSSPPRKVAAFDLVLSICSVKKEDFIDE